MLSGGNKIQIQTLLQWRYIYFTKIENYSTVAQSENMRIVYHCFRRHSFETSPM